MGGVVAAMEAVFEGAQKAGGGLGEAVDEILPESLVGDAGEAVTGVAGESSEAHRGRLLEFDRDAAAGGVFDGLLDLLADNLDVASETASEGQDGKR